MLKNFLLFTKNYNNFNFINKYKNAAKMFSYSRNNAHNSMNKNINSYYKKNESNSISIQEENKKIKRITENPEEVVKLTEIDIHRALEQSGKLPENDLKEIVANNDVQEARLQIEENILPLLNTFLNRSLVEVLKVAKKNTKIFHKFENFWISLEQELETRENSLSNEQISEIVSAYSKCCLTERIKFYEKFEEIVMESPVAFNVQ
jgi:hypothetical protein